MSKQLADYNVMSNSLLNLRDELYNKDHNSVAGAQVDAREMWLKLNSCLFREYPQVSAADLQNRIEELEKEVRCLRRALLQEP